MRPAFAGGARIPVRTRLPWRHPAWWSLALSAIAWLLLLAGVPFGEGGSHASGHVHDHVASGGGFAWWPETYLWSLMVVAMMTPLVLGSIVTTAARSLWRRRIRAVCGFLAGYLGLWLLVGAAFLGVVALLGVGDWLRSPVAAAGGLALAAAWQLTPVKRRALRSCHRTAPLAPRGWRADRDCVGYGWMIGERCLLSCWALMLACVLAGHGLAIMVGVGIIVVAERYRPRPDQRVNAALLTGFAIVAASGVV